MKEIRQTHCLLDCIAYALQTGRAVDDRPMYFGVWNAPFAATDEGISYYSETIGVGDIVDRFERLYGEPLRFLNDRTHPKSRNYAVLLDRLANKTDEQFIFVLVDLFYLSSPNPCYQVRHRPHIVIVDRIAGDRCGLIDPYFSWQGDVPLEMLESAFYYRDLNLAVMLDKHGLRDPDAEALRRWADSRMFHSPGPLAAQVDGLIDQLLAQEDGSPLDRLASSIEQIGVLVKRLNGYNQAFSYLNDALHIPNDGSGKAEPLARKWDNLLLAAMRVAITGKREGLHSLKKIVAEIVKLEFQINGELSALYERWGGKSDRVTI